MNADLVLIVDDREADFKESMWSLEDAGVNKDLIHWARSFDQGLALVEEHHPRTVLMDINLGVDEQDGGIRLTEQLKKLNGYEITVLTTSAKPSDIDDAFAAGALAYIEKTEGQVFADSIEAWKWVFQDRNLCPVEWRDRFVKIVDALVG